jgi:hypothetical protein
LGVPENLLPNTADSWVPIIEPNPLQARLFYNFKANGASTKERLSVLSLSIVTSDDARDLTSDLLLSTRISKKH